jgi:hypothetical protein
LERTLSLGVVVGGHAGVAGVIGAIVEPQDEELGVGGKRGAVFTADMELLSERVHFGYPRCRLSRLGLAGAGNHAAPVSEEPGGAALVEAYLTDCQYARVPV